MREIDAGLQRRLQHALIARHGQFDTERLDADDSRFPGLAFEQTEHAHFLCGAAVAALCARGLKNTAAPIPAGIPGPR